jgi:PAS domain S-box-containing protein
LAIPPGYATAVWPASGIALAGILLFGYRVWPGILLGSLLINLRVSLDATSTASLLNTSALAASIGMGASLQAVVGAFLIRRFTPYPTAFTEAREIIKFLLLAGPISCLMNATWSVTSLRLGGVIQPVDYLFHWWTWWVGDAIGVITFTPLILIWVAKPAVFSRGRQVSLLLCLAFTLVVVFFIYTNAWEQDRVRLEFKRRTDQLGQQLQVNFDNYILVLQSVENLYASGFPINRQQFKTFVSRWISHHPGIRAITWSPRILDSERATYEQAARQDGLIKFQITERNPQGQLVRAASRAEYIPTYYSESIRGNGRALGFDSLSDPVRRKALNRARDTEKPTASDPLTLIQDFGREGGFVVFLPIYKPGLPREALEERRLNLQGYVSGAFLIRDIMNTAFKGSKVEDIEIRLYDARVREKKRLLYEHRSEEIESQNLPVEASENIQSAQFQRVIPFEIAGRQWSVQFAPTKKYLIAQRGWQAWSVLAGGLFFTGLLGGFLLVITGHTTKLQTINTDLENEIIERKRAEEAATQLAAIVESSDDAIVGTTLEGIVISWNKAAELVYGYSAAEMKGHPISILVPSELLDERARLAERIKEGGHVTQYETIRLRKGGAQVHVSLTLSPMKNAAGEITAVASIARDITERKRAESDLQKLQQLAATRERNRLARDLHDSVLQSLAVAGLNLEAAIHGLEVNTEFAVNQLRGVQDLLVREQRELRSVIDELKLATLVRGETDFKIGYLLQQLAKTVEQQWQLHVELKIDGLNGCLPPVLTREIYLIIRESLVNAARHSHASVVEVDFKADDHNAHVTISDNGCGFPFRGSYDDAALTSTGLGPAIIKSRIASLGGTLNIDSSESGARLEMILPVSSAGA